MSTSLESVPLKYRSSSDYLASLPPWRRLLARLNWHPVREIEIETWRVRSEKQRLRNEKEQIRKETEQIRRETELIKKETDQLRKENEQLRQERLKWQQLDAQIEALFCSDGSCSTPAPTTDDGSTPS
jgi:hypothetical protein